MEQERLAEPTFYICNTVLGNDIKVYFTSRHLQCEMCINTPRFSVMTVDFLISASSRRLTKKIS